MKILPINMFLTPRDLNVSSYRFQGRKICKISKNLILMSSPLTSKNQRFNFKKSIQAFVMSKLLKRYPLTLVDKWTESSQTKCLELKFITKSSIWQKQSHFFEIGRFWQISPIEKEISTKLIFCFKFLRI